RVPRSEPDRIDPEFAQVAEPRAHASEIAYAVAVSVRETADVDLIDDGVAPPVRIVGAGDDDRSRGGDRSTAEDGCVHSGLISVNAGGGTMPGGISRNVVRLTDLRKNYTKRKKITLACVALRPLVADRSIRARPIQARNNTHRSRTHRRSGPREAQSPCAPSVQSAGARS